MDSKQLFAEALRLSDEERAALAGELIQSLEHGAVVGSPSALPRRYPFGVVCRVERTRLIVATAHGHRRPGYWRDRQPGPGES